MRRVSLPAGACACRFYKCFPYIMPETGLSHSMSPLVDAQGRAITYLRLAVTDRCNLRCIYCMPPTGIDFLPRDQILTFEEMERLTRIFAAAGVRKIRITGGEPFVRKGLVDFMGRLAEIPGITALHVTTNGVLAAPHLPALAAMGLAGLNISLDTLRPERFLAISRRDDFAAVRRTLEESLRLGIATKVNAVIQEGVNDDEILPLSRLARHAPLDVRFIEQMAFNGCSTAGAFGSWDAARIIKVLRKAYPGLQEADAVHSTARLFEIPGFQGRVGVIGGHSRTFCQTCNKVRIVPRGVLKTCLYDQGVLDLRQMLRDGAADEALLAAVRDRIGRRAKDGLATENEIIGGKFSMATIGG